MHAARCTVWGCARGGSAGWAPRGVLLACPACGGARGARTLPGRVMCIATRLCSSKQRYPRHHHGCRAVDHNQSRASPVRRYHLRRWRWRRAQGHRGRGRQNGGFAPPCARMHACARTHASRQPLASCPERVARVAPWPSYFARSPRKPCRKPTACAGLTAPPFAHAGPAGGGRSQNTPGWPLRHSVSVQGLGLARHVQSQAVVLLRQE